MTKFKHLGMLTLNLQLFADGGAGTGTGAGAGGTDGGSAASTEGAMGENTSLDATKKSNRSKKVNPLANVKYGKQPASEVTSSQDDSGNVTTNTQADGVGTTEEGVTEPVDRRKAFEERINGEDKDLFDERVQKILKGRLKDSKANEETLGKVAPVLQIIGEKYGVDVSDIKTADIDKLQKAILDDDSLYEAEALEKGMDIELLKHVKNMERENKEFHQREQERLENERNAREWQRIIGQAEEAKQFYPSLDIQAEMENPDFGRLVVSGVPVQTAYEVVHRNELQPQAMQMVANKVEQKIANSVKANSRRPAENGLSSQSTSVYKSDPRNLTKQDREEIRRRVARGERISF